MENKPVDLLGDTGENYENLPFHGLQNPPNKVTPWHTPFLLIALGFWDDKYLQRN